MSGSTFVVLNRSHIADNGSCRVIPELSLRPPLPQQIPALVELLGHMLESCGVVFRLPAISAELVLFFDQCTDVFKNRRVAHV